jgi:ATP-binding cassette, subfamily B, bacterial
MTRMREALQRFAREAEIDTTSLAPTVSLREVARRFWPAVRPYRARLAVVLVLAMLGPLLDTLSISLYGRLVDEVLVPRQLAMLGPIAAAYVGLTVFGGILGFGRSYLSAWVTEHLLFDLRNRLFVHLQTLPLEFFERARLGDTVTRVTDDIDEVGEFLAEGLADGISHLLKIIFFVGALFYIDARLAVISLLVAPPFWFLGRRFATRVKALAREQRARDGAVTAIVEECLGNAPLVQAYNGQVAAASSFEHETRTVMTTQLALERLRAGYVPIINLIEVGGMLIVIGIGAVDLSEGRVTLGGLLAFLAYLTQLYDPVRGLNRLWGQAVATSAAAERVIELMDRQPSVVESVDPLPLNRAAGSIDFDGVSYRYPGTNQDALTDVSFTLAPGETLALVGQSGAGKSTATRLLLRLDDPSTGRILIDGHDLRDVSITSLRENVTVLPQEALFFDVTVREAIAYGRPGASNEEIVEAARIAGAHQFIELLPEGYDTRVGQRGRSLSGGQRQRLAIARALLRDAPVLVLDEPTTGLDNENATQILESVRRLMEGKTTIIVSHDLHLVRQATRIVVLERGRVVEEGNHEALIMSNGLYARLSLAHQRDSQTGITGGSRPGGMSGDRRREARGGRWRDAQVASPLGTTRAAS